MKSLRYKVLILVTLVALALATVPAGAEPAAIDLGTLGGAWSETNGINDGGQIVGASETASGEMHAFLWQDRTMTDLGTLGGSESQGIRINARGQVVGLSTTDAGIRHAFLWQNGVMTDLGTLGGGESYARGINGLGQVVGASEAGPGKTVHAFLWKSGVMADLGTLGKRQSYAWAINNLGQVAGYSDTSQGETHAFLWQNGNMTDLGTLGGKRSFAYAINNQGQVVGAFIVWDLPSKENTLGVIFIDPEFQDCGIGTQAWEFIEATYSDALSWTLETPEWALKNHHFYAQKCGFKQVGQKDEQIIFKKVLA